jgi:small subunit ribosomal protein S5
MSHEEEKKKNDDVKITEEEVIKPKIDLSSWEPTTKLGRMVKGDEIKTIHDVLKFPGPIREVEIIDKLLPDLREEIISVGRVQRVTDSGRRMRFRIVVIVGNENGYVGVGEAKGKEAGPTIRKAIIKAKLRIKEVKRGCGSWECGCGLPHTVPFKVQGKAGSVRVNLLPAPHGTGLVAGEIPKKILTLAGIKDVYVKTEGHTRTNINFANAIVDALVNTSKIKISDKKAEILKITSGAG